MFKTLANAWKVPELRKKLLYTLLLLVIFRFGAVITAPGVDAVALNNSVQDSSNTLSQMIDFITGGAFSQLSIFAMSISPYITASIVIQLLTYAIPALEELSKEGEEGRKQISRYTKYLAVVLAAIEAFGLYITYRGRGIFIGEGVLVPLLFVLSLTAGSTFLMWIGDQITSKGVGNGISLLIFAGIVSGIPTAGRYLYDVAINGFTFNWGFGAANDIVETISRSVHVPGLSEGSPLGLIVSLLVIIGSIILVAGVVWVTEAERRVPVQYAKRVVGRKMYGGQNTHIPIKLAMAGVMPVIFAMSFMQFPSMIIQLINPAIATSTGFWAGVYKVFAYTSLTDVGFWPYGVIHSLIYLLLIVGFTFFYTMMVFNPVEVSNNLKKNGGFIPGIRAGKPTSDFLQGILKYINWFGAFFLGIIAILPILVRFVGLQVSFGGTAILIIVGVALETIKQLESQMLVRHYKGFLE